MRHSRGKGSQVYSSQTKRCVVAALSAALAVMWRPIDEAPKDGTSILGYWLPITGAYAQNAGRAFGVVIWEKGTWCNPDNTDDDYRDPSMWMPLPSPPKMEG